jgi:hypothetical protein
VIHQKEIMAQGSKLNAESHKRGKPNDFALSFEP